MIKKTINMTDSGEIINEKVQKIKIIDPEKGYLWKAKAYNTKMFHDFNLSDIVPKQSEYAKIHLLAENLYKQTNTIMIRLTSKKVKFTDVQDISKIIGLCELKTKSFLKKMISLDIIAKRIDKIGDRIETKYLLNPLFFFTNKYLSADLYFTFKKSLKPFLPTWVSDYFEEEGVLSNEISVEIKKKSN